MLIFLKSSRSERPRKGKQEGDDTRKKIMEFLKEKGINLKKSKMEELVDEIEDKIESNI